MESDGKQHDCVLKDKLLTQDGIEFDLEECTIESLPPKCAELLDEAIETKLTEYPSNFPEDDPAFVRFRRYTGNVACAANKMEDFNATVKFMKDKKQIARKRAKNLSPLLNYTA